MSNFGSHELLGSSSGPTSKHPEAEDVPAREPLSRNLVCSQLRSHRCWFAVEAGRGSEPFRDADRCPCIPADLPRQPSRPPPMDRRCRVSLAGICRHAEQRRYSRPGARRKPAGVRWGFALSPLENYLKDKRSEPRWTLTQTHWLTDRSIHLHRGQTRVATFD